MTRRARVYFRQKHLLNFMSPLLPHEPVCLSALFRGRIYLCALTADAHRGRKKMPHFILREFKMLYLLQLLMLSHGAPILRLPPAPPFIGHFRFNAPPRGDYIYRHSADDQLFRPAWLFTPEACRATRRPEASDFDGAIHRHFEFRLPQALKRRSRAHDRAIPAPRGKSRQRVIRPVLKDLLRDTVATGIPHCLVF